MKCFKLLYVYLVECTDGSFYTGVTNNIDRRLNEHNMGLNSGAYTFDKRPVVLKYCQAFTDYNLAIKREKQIKGWSKQKKLALIQENFEQLIILSNEKNMRKGFGKRSQTNKEQNEKPSATHDTGTAIT
ncbi:MAG: GIY-YIG nuclease family protein [Bacteroidia bacterium]|nr:GIY-YIG nuclease family protein [Bacteroidia bacterium]